MNQDSQGKSNPSSPWSEWMESTTNFWMSAAKSWPGVSPSGSNGAGEAGDQMKSAVEMWKTMFSPWMNASAGPCSAETKPFSDMFMNMLRVMGEGQPGFGFNQEYFKWFLNAGEPAKAFGFENFQREILKAWTDFHEREVQPLLKIPQVGLNRVYQERVNRLMDKFNTYQAALAEFQHLLSLPMEKSFLVMREELEKLRNDGKLTEDYKAYYSMWIKVLEEHYMALFRSGEYNEALSRLLNETAAFKMTRNEILIDLLQFLPIPTNKDMDEVYKELYLLKKQVKESAKKIRELESLLAQHN